MLVTLIYVWQDQKKLSCNSYLCRHVNLETLRANVRARKASVGVVGDILWQKPFKSVS